MNLVAATPEAIRRAAQLLIAGRLIAFPTETVYGLGANANDPEAVSRIFRAKGRPANNPLIVHVASVSVAQQVVDEWPAIAHQLTDLFWPGPLTLVLPKRSHVPDSVTAGGSSVGVRVPNHPVALALLLEAAIPIAAPSANKSTEVSPTTAQHVLKSLGATVDLILDGGPCTGGIESTVLDLTSDQPRILRPGLVTADQIERVIGPIHRSLEKPSSEPLRSPGLTHRHYSPRAPLELVDDGDDKRVVELIDQGLKPAWLTLSSSALVEGVIRIRMPRDAAEYAARLYSALHEADDGTVDRIIVEMPPDEPDWFAIRDRLQRAETK